MMMKTQTLLFLFVLLFLLLTLIHVADAQGEFELRVRLKSGNRISGTLVYCKQDSLTISNRRSSKPIDLGVSEIQSIQVRGNGKVVNILKGACAGATAGAMVGQVMKVQTDRHEHYFLGPEMARFADVGTIGLFVGGITGTIMSESRKKFKINGDRTRFELFRNHVRESRSEISTIPQQLVQSVK